MESAHLTKAHEHARNAATATYGNSVATAGKEHELASLSFHEAAQDTHNAEALRILGLLEDHHLKLARLIKEPPQKQDKSNDAAPRPTENTSASPPPKSSTARTSSPSPSTSSTPAPSRRRLPQSSIASNLAEKRGIPGARRGTPSSSTVSVTNALASRNERQSTPVRDLLQQQSRKAEEASKHKEEVSIKQKEPPISRNISPPPEDNFRRFYSAFGGVINAISAPLAFTSLPLTLPTNAQPPSQPSSPTKLKQKSQTQPLDDSRTIKSSEPDLRSLISKPALHALREDQSGPFGPFANNESFYVVPTSGGTVTYASILRDPQAHPHHAAQDPHLDSIAEGDNEGGGGLRGSSHEEFVDARESIGPPSPTTRRPRSKGSTTAGGVTSAANIRAGRGNGLKTMEELQLENETLRNLIDKQAKRLSMWETTSQSSYNALAQSFRARGAGGIQKQMSDPSALAHALAMGSNAVPLPSPPAAPHIPAQYQNQPSSPDPFPTTNDKEHKERDRRIAELEVLLAQQTSQITSLTSEKDQLARQNEKHGQVIGRYREQWEKLKAGARKKEQERRERRVAELKAGEPAKDSESGENEVEESVEEEGFGKA